MRKEPISEPIDVDGDSQMQNRGSKEETKITIGLCVRNEEETIDETIASIAEQDFPHNLIELAIMDDGSTDRTLSAIVRSVAEIDIRVKVFQSRWRGIGPARNTGLQNAKGEYIVWVDGGMTLPKNHVWKQVEFMEANTNVGIAKAKCGSFVDESVVSTLESMQYLAFDYRYDGIVESFVIGVGGSTYRTKAARQVGGFDNTIRRSGEDLDIETRMREAGWSVYRTSTLFYRKHSRSWKSAWNDSVKYGYGGHYLIHKHRERVSKRSLVSLLDGVINVRIAYKLTRRKLAFLLLFHHFFKRVAWVWGFLRAHLERNEPSVQSNADEEEPRWVYSQQSGFLTSSG